MVLRTNPYVLCLTTHIVLYFDLIKSKLYIRIISCSYEDQDTAFVTVGRLSQIFIMVLNWLFQRSAIVLNWCRTSKFFRIVLSHNPQLLCIKQNDILIMHIIYAYNATNSNLLLCKMDYYHCQLHTLTNFKHLRGQ